MATTTAPRKKVLRPVVYNVVVRSTTDLEKLTKAVHSAAIKQGRSGNVTVNIVGEASPQNDPNSLLD